MIFKNTVEIIDKSSRSSGTLFTNAIDELKNAERVVQAAIAVVKNPAYAGICDEDVDLERALKQGGFL
jgi:hypothetical protein